MTHAVYPSLAGKTVVITGGGSGIGEVIVEGFVEFDFEITLLTVRAVSTDVNNVRNKGAHLIDPV